MSISNLYFEIELTARRIRHYGQSVLNERGIDLTVEQWLVMKEVSENEGINQLSLGERLLKDKPTISRMVKQLDQKGYIQRETSPLDQRAYLLSMTEKGKKMIHDIMPTVEGIRLKGLSKLSKTEKESLSQVLRKIRASLEE